MALLTPKAKSTSCKENNSKKGGNNSELYNRLASYQSSQNRWIPLTIISLLVLNILSQCSIKNEIRTVQRQEKYAFLQKADGSTERIEQVNSTDRSIPILKKFAYDWTKTCFTWTGMIDGKPDQGIEQFGRRFPSKFFNCSVAISPDFKQTYMEGLFDLYDDHPVFKDQLSMRSFVGSNIKAEKREVQIYVEPLEPVKVSAGVWDIPVVATREFRRSGQSFAVEKFNQTLRLKAIPPYLPPWSKDQTDFGKLLDDWQRQGLQIVRITRLRDRLQ